MVSRVEPGGRGPNPISGGGGGRAKAKEAKAAVKADKKKVPSKSPKSNVKVIRAETIGTGAPNGRNWQEKLRLMKAKDGFTAKFDATMVQTGPPKKTIKIKSGK